MRLEGNDRINAVFRTVIFDGRYEKFGLERVPVIYKSLQKSCEDGCCCQV